MKKRVGNGSSRRKIWLPSKADKWQGGSMQEEAREGSEEVGGDSGAGVRQRVQDEEKLGYRGNRCSGKKVKEEKSATRGPAQLE